MFKGGSARRAHKLLLGLAIVFGTLAVPSFAHAASVFVTPSNGQYVVGKDFAVTVRVDTASQAVNAVEGVLSFNPSIVSVRSISSSGSIFNLNVQEPEFSNTAGTVHFAGVILNPGYTGVSGNLITINFKPIAIGKVTVAFVSAAVLANDGQGTNLLQGLGRGVYTIVPASTVSPTPTPTANPGTGLPSAPVIKSSTHPDPARWYNSNAPLFSWNVPTGVSEVRLVLAQRASSVPQIKYAPAISEKALTDVADGIWYLNAQFRSSAGLSPVSSFRFNVDTTPPQQFTISRLDASDATNPAPNIQFLAKDNTSGIDHYELTVDGTGSVIIIPSDLAGKPYAVTLLTPGIHKLAIDAVDKAGNKTTATLDVRVEPISAPEITQYPLNVEHGGKIHLLGTAEPGYTVMLFAIANGEHYSGLSSVADTSNRVGEVVADANGNWTLDVDAPAAGTYAFYAYAHDARNALSNSSNVVNITIKSGPNIFSGLLTWLNGLLNSVYLQILIFFALCLILLVGLLWYLAGLLRRFWFFIIAKRSKEPSKVGSKLAELLQDIEEEMALLDRIGHNRPLYPEERYLRSKLVQYRKTVKFLLTDTHSHLAKKK